MDQIQFEGMASFEMHDTAWQFFNSPAQTRVIIKGNQGGGTRVCMHDLGMRLMKIHPAEDKNRLQAPIRCVSKTLPKSDEDEENQQYVELKKILPPEMILKDLTHRLNHMTIKDPHGGSPNKVEFMSKKQDIDAFMSVQRQAVYQDEEIERIKWDENQMRLLRYNGDTTLTLTPVRGLDWTYDQIWKRARVVYRSDVICEKFGYPKVEEFESDNDIAIFCWATDDNPAMDKFAVKRIFQGFDEERDADELAMRRYGVFKQVSGRIYKAFDRAIHVLPYDDYWNPDQFMHYWHYRIIDYHPHKPWYVTWAALSDKQELFVWNEWVASHEKATVIDLRDIIKEKSLLSEHDENNRRTIVDPLARMTQPDPDRRGYSELSIFDHLQRGEFGLRRVQTADTRNSANQGRMNVRTRLKNALECGVPENNVVEADDHRYDPKYGGYLPTIWFLNHLKGHIEHFMNWREMEWKTEQAKAEHEAKRPTERWSDFCRNIEFLCGTDPIFYHTSDLNTYEPRAWFRRAS